MDFDNVTAVGDASTYLITLNTCGDLGVASRPTSGGCAGPYCALLIEGQELFNTVNGVSQSDQACECHESCTSCHLRVLSDATDDLKPSPHHCITCRADRIFCPMMLKSGNVTLGYCQSVSELEEGEEVCPGLDFVGSRIGEWSPEAILKVVLLCAGFLAFLGILYWILKRRLRRALMMAIETGEPQLVMSFRSMVMVHPTGEVTAAQFGPDGRPIPTRQVTNQIQPRRLTDEELMAKDKKAKEGLVQLQIIQPDKEVQSMLGLIDQPGSSKCSKHPTRPSFRGDIHELMVPSPHAPHHTDPSATSITVAAASSSASAAATAPQSSSVPSPRGAPPPNPLPTRNTTPDPPHSNPPTNPGSPRPTHVPGYISSPPNNRPHTAPLQSTTSNPPHRTFQQLFADGSSEQGSQEATEQDVAAGVPQGSLSSSLTALSSVTNDLPLSETAFRAMRDVSPRATISTPPRLSQPADNQPVAVLESRLTPVMCEGHHPERSSLAACS